MSGRGKITRILDRHEHGDGEVLGEIFPLIYEELRRIAASRMRRERRDHTLQPTALVHDVYLKLVDQKEVSWKGRAHFLAIAGQQMRRILVDHARTRQRAKRGGGRKRRTLSALEVDAGVPEDDVLAVDEALEELAAFDPKKAEIVEMRFFGGMTQEQIGEVIGLSRRSVDRGWDLARRWLYRRLRGESDRSIPEET